ncbi:MAG TPA: glycerate kinase [Acidimicrobiales bacterium]|jgi:glycerate kinase
MARLVIAPDKFRGTATARQLIDAVTVAAGAAGWSATGVPMADGGEGTLDALGGPNRVATVTGPLGDTVEAEWRLDRRTAVIEMARASGLELVGGAEGNDALAASTYGTGELIALALDSGARRIVVGLGGSATTDGGLGALRALSPLPRLRGVELIGACDVRTSFVAAAQVFAPQKGASESEVELLRRRLERLADIYLEEHHVDVRDIAGSGAAGGLGGALAAIGGELVDGFELVADDLGLADEVETADLVITGEGLLDDESFEGKVVGGVVGLAASLDVPCLVVVGAIDPDMDRSLLGGATVVSLADRFGDAEARRDTSARVAEVVADVLSSTIAP